MPQTGVPIVDWFLALLDAWGYLIVFGFTIFENLFVIGSLTPGETVVIAAATVASRDQLHLSGVWLSSVAGTTVGSFISYALGRRAGLDAVRAFAERVAASKLGRLFRIEAGSLDDVHEHFHTEGAKTVFISRFAIGVKNFVPAVAGATAMPFFWFALYTLLGAITYTTAMSAIGWFLGQNLEHALKVASGVGWFGLAIMALFVAGIVAGRRRIVSRRESQRADETPASSADADAGDAE